jgi:hypothetical protein
MLMAAVVGKSWSVAALPVEKGKSEQSSKKTTDGSATDDTTTVSELSLHAVVTPALSFDFTQSLFVLPHAFLYHFEEKAAISLAARTSFYYFSYFRHVFGHHIAPNGP